MKRTQGALRIKTDLGSRRGSVAASGTPSPRTLSPRPTKTMKLSHNDSMPMLNIPLPSPSNSTSPMEYSPGPISGTSFNYSGDSSYSTMPSFSGSQESRHGRQRK